MAGTGGSTRGFSDDARLCDRSRHRSFAGFCTSILRVGDAVRGSRGSRSGGAPQHLSSGAAALQSGAMPTRICWRTLGAMRSPCGVSFITSTWATGRIRRSLRPGHHTKFAGASAEELAKEVERGLAHGPQVNVPVLSGHCEVAQRIAERIGLPEQIRETSVRSTSAGMAKGCRAVFRGMR